jgi:hypothetical protein
MLSKEFRHPLTVFGPALFAGDLDLHDQVGGPCFTPEDPPDEVLRLIERYSPY